MVNATADFADAELFNTEESMVRTNRSFYGVFEVRNTNHYSSIIAARGYLNQFPEPPKRKVSIL